MSQATEALAPTALRLPPAFSLATPPAGTGAFAYACCEAGRMEPGTLVWSPGRDLVDFAVVLQPEEPLATARRAFVVGMGALVHAVASVAPPDKPLRIDWPDTIRFDGARLGGGRLGWPDDGDEGAEPAFLVFGATLVASKGADDPGLTPDSTSLEEEGFEPGCGAALVEAFARHLLRGFDAWQDGSFEATAGDYLGRLSGPDHRPVALDEVGNLVGAGSRRELLPALRAPAWLDDRTGSPRL
jgi:biotin-(acetyl-CoA carboxylase) ligase